MPPLSSPARLTAATQPVVQIPVKDFTDGIHPFQLKVLQDAHRFRVLVWHRRSRKTTLGLNQLIHEACRNRNHSYIYIAPTYNQAKSIIVRDPNMLSRYLPREVLKKPFNESELYAEFLTGSVLSIKGADDPDSLKGLNAHGIIFDEYSLMKPEIYTEMFRPVLTQSGGWAQFQFTPKGRNHAWDMWNRSQQGGAFSGTMLKASSSGLIKPEDLDEARKEMGDDLFAQEFECAFLEGAVGVFRGWPACVVGDLLPSEAGHRYVMGVDIGRVHDATVLTVMDIQTRHVVAHMRLTESLYSSQRSAIAAMAKAYNNAFIWMDTTGITAGDPMLEDLRQLGLQGEGVKFSQESKRQLVEGLRIAIANRLITFPKIPQLLEELEEFQITMSERGQIYYGCPEGEGFFDDCVISLALAVKGLQGDLYGPHIRERSKKEDWREEWKGKRRSLTTSMAA